MSKPREPKEAKSSNENAPFCKICQTRHWSRDPHVFPKTTKAKKGKNA